jgi:hypothetical protein
MVIGSATALSGKITKAAMKMMNVRRLDVVIRPPFLEMLDDVSPGTSGWIGRHYMIDM